MKVPKGSQILLNIIISIYKKWLGIGIGILMGDVCDGMGTAISTEEQQ